jgi:hypothetical protein
MPLESLKGRQFFADLHLYERRILKRVLKKCGGRMWVVVT